MVFLILFGLILGIVVSIPLGVLGAYMINRVLERGFWQGFFIALTGSFLDTIYSLASLMGIYLIIGLPRLRFVIQAVGLLFLIYVGFKIFLDKKRKETFFKAGNKKSDNSLNGYLRDGVIVGIFYFLNPTIAAFWINVASVLHSLSFFGKSIFAQVVFSLSVGIGGLIASLFFISLTLKYRRNPLSASIIKSITAVFYFLTLIFFAFYLARIGLSAF